MLGEREERQLFLLGKQIEGFEEGSLSLRDLVDRSWALLAALEIAGGVFLRNYRALLGQLEVIVALESESGQPTRGWRTSDDVRPAVQQMKRLLDGLQTNGSI